MWAMEEYIEHEWWENAALLTYSGTRSTAVPDTARARRR